MLLSSLCVCLGQLFWKLAATDANLLFLAIGFCLYGMGAMIMIVAYRFGSLSVLQPMLSMNYVLTILLASWILHESFSWLKLIGITLITIGVILIGGGDEQE